MEIQSQRGAAETFSLRTAPPAPPTPPFPRPFALISPAVIGQGRGRQEGCAVLGHHKFAFLGYKSLI